mmetsp:Transcript_38717/g.95963  ORF Transcript_38717/g.95963 Transcript_38717/m.95963 type:complete len:406 (-) Transcript_38717:233-1450(-)
MSSQVLFRHAMQLDEACQALAAPVHTLGLVFVLSVRANALAQASSSPLAATFVHRCRQLLLHADPVQVALAPVEFSRLCQKFLSFALPQPQGALGAVRPLLAAAAAMQPTPSHITPIHALALQAAILARTYRAVVPLLASTLVQVSAPRTALSAHDVLLFHYYSGIALIGLKRHREAMLTLQLALVSPATVVNSLMVESYKKWTLCALIATRALPVLPKYASTVVQRNARGCAPAYNELAGAFASRDRAKLSKVLSQHAATYNNDGNTGLTKQVSDAFTKEAIVRLSRTYLTLSLADIAASTGLGSTAEAEALLVKMVEKGELRAQVDCLQAMALFEDTNAPDGAELKGALESRLESVVALSQKLHELHDELASDALYLGKTADKDERGGARWAAAERAEDMVVI